jgi:hypothetical protein
VGTAIATEATADLEAGAILNQFDKPIIIKSSPILDNFEADRNN